MCRYAVSFFCSLLMLFAAPVYSQNRQNENSVEQDTGGAEESEQPSPEPIVIDVPFSRSTDSVKKANELFDAMVKAYRSAPAIRDEVNVRVQTSFQGKDHEQASDVKLVMSPQSSRINLNGTVIIVIDETLYAQYEERPKRFFALDFDGPVTTQLFTDLVGGFTFPQYAAMYSEKPLRDVYIHTLDPKIVGYREAMGETGTKYPEILVEPEREGVPVILRFDPTTKLLRQLRADMSESEFGEGNYVTITVTMKPTILPIEPIEDFVIDTDELAEVPTFMALFQPPSTSSLAKEQAPAFSIVDQNETTILSEGFLGEVLVVVFWDVPTDSLFSIFETLTELNGWLERSGLRVKLIPLNFGDRTEDINSIIEFRNVDYPVYRDPAGMRVRTDYQLQVLPTTVIIAADGTVHQVIEYTEESSFTLEDLQNSIREALAREM